MKAETVAALNRINGRFYDEFAPDFDRHRRHPWSGWRQLLPYLPADRPTGRVLDVGCGNGRLGEFLAAELALPELYCGLDASRRLLAVARTRLAGWPAVELHPLDLLAELPGDLWQRNFGWAALFAVLHHIPGFAQRRRLLWAVQRILAESSALAVSFWRFLDEPRLAGRVVPWQEGLEELEISLDLADLEQGDVLLRFGDQKRALRFCHYSSEAETQRLLAGLGTLVAQYRADGHRRNLNAYYLLRSASS